MDEPKQRMKRLCLTLDAFTIAEAKRRGNGNVSLGIRRALLELEQKDSPLIRIWNGPKARAALGAAE